MSIIDNNFIDLCVFKNTTILEAMECIENGTERLCFVVENNFQLIQVLTDGDVRRAILSGIKLDDSINKLRKK